MATSSILKNINIKDKQLVRMFVQALEEAESTKYEPAEFTREYKEITGDKIKGFFENKSSIR